MLLSREILKAASIKACFFVSQTSPHAPLLLRSALNPTFSLEHAFRIKSNAGMEDASTTYLAIAALHSRAFISALAPYPSRMSQEELKSKNSIGSGAHSQQSV
jgi:hypothetical protein